VSFGRRLIAAAAAFVLAIVAVMPVLVEARHAPSATFLAHEIGSDATHDPASDEENAGDLIHHAQAHAQGVMPSSAGASTVRTDATMAFVVAHEGKLLAGRPVGLFKPPRA
jgi:hypothetical protein